MSYYTQCPDCGANLDPCERCTCTKEEAAPDAATSKSGKNTKAGVKKYPECTTATSASQGGSK